MTAGKFWKGLMGVIGLTAFALWIMDLLYPDTHASDTFIIITSVTFIGIVIGAYFLGLRAVRSESKVRFIQLVMMIIFVKMIICILLVGMYIKIMRPDTKAFIIPFLMVYLIFTIFEVVVLERVARLRKSDG